MKDRLQEWQGKSILVFGMGRTGASLLKVLQQAGVRVVVGDDNPEALEPFIRDGVAVWSPEHSDMGQFSLVLLSPGVPFTHPAPHEVVRAAQEAGVEVIGDLEFFFRHAGPRRTIGITGTNGKSTTASLIAHILKSCGFTVELAGNIGRPIFDITMFDAETIFVLEMSSFQIDLCPSFRPDCAVILNVTPDHLDRHGTMEQYAGVKERLAQGPGQAVIAGDDPYTRAMIKRLRAAQEREVIEVSTTAPLKDGVYEQNEILYEAEEGAVQIIGGLSGLPALMGVHNAQNAACAFAATEAFGCGREEIYSALRSFPGLQHRQFLTRTINGVAYVNDSKATNAAAAAVALGCWENIYWIVGGRKKKNGLDGLEAFFPRIREAFIIGETTDEFAAWFERYGVVHIKCYTMDAAVLAAHRGAQAHRGQPGGGAVVLLSPACASLDQFTSFEQRGQVFESLVQALSEA